jgi:hypothetical protein
MRRRNCVGASVDGAERGPAGDLAATSHGWNSNAAAVLVATLSAALLSAVFLAAPAHADPVATVKARTQRMSDANLTSHEVGWYTPGEKLTLVCSMRGQAVKGFFSFNIPNGGWDNLWYKTSDNSFVADVDIETGTLKDVTPDCGAGPAAAPAPAPAPSGDRGAQALAWARNQMATNPNREENGYPVQCEVFVEEAYNHAFKYPSAIAAFNDLRTKGQIHTNTDGIPAGALVFTSDPRFDRGDGHVMLSQGDGHYLTANYVDAPHIRVVPLNSDDPQDRFLGWAYAP